MRGAGVAALAAALALSGPPASAVGHRDHRTTEASLNVYVGNPGWAVRHDVRAAMDRADLVRIQEAQHGHTWRAIRSAVHARPWWRLSRRAHPPGELPVLWNSREWRSAGPMRVLLVYPRNAADGPRHFTWKPLRHRGSGAVVNVANAHPIQRPMGTTFRAQLSNAYWSVVTRWTRNHARRTALLGGDFNASLTGPMPRAVLSGLYRLPLASGVDHLVTSRTPGHPVTVRRVRLPVLSDHPLVLRTLRWLP